MSIITPRINCLQGDLISKVLHLVSYDEGFRQKLQSAVVICEDWVQNLFEVQFQFPVKEENMQNLGQLSNNSYNLQAESGKRISNYLFYFQDLIGFGNFARVYRGINQLTREQVAIKVIELDTLKSKKLEQLVFQEINVLQKVSHPNILTFHAALMSNRRCYIITELCEGGDLNGILQSKKEISEEWIAPIILDVLQGLKYLREMKIIHRDLKPANIFLSNGRAKIADFGLAKFYNIERFRDLDIGTAVYMSPEGLCENVYSEKTDIWALGILMYEMFHGVTPLAHCVYDSEIKQSIWYPFVEERFKPNLPPLLRRFIMNMLRIEDSLRPNIYQLSEDPYVKFLLSFRKGADRQKEVNNCSSAVKGSHSSQLSGPSSVLGQKRQESDTGRIPQMKSSLLDDRNRKASSIRFKNIIQFRNTNQDPIKSERIDATTPQRKNLVPDYKNFISPERRIQQPRSEFNIQLFSQKRGQLLRVDSCIQQRKEVSRNKISFENSVAFSGTKVSQNTMDSLEK